MFRSLRVVRVILMGIFFFRDIYCTGAGYYESSTNNQGYDRIELLTDGFVKEGYGGNVPVSLRKMMGHYYSSKDTAVISMTAEPALINPKTVENLKSFLNVQTSEEHLVDQRDGDASEQTLLDCSIEKNVFNYKKKTTVLFTLSNFKTPSNRIAEIIIFGEFQINWRVNHPDLNNYMNQIRAMQKFMSNVTDTTLDFDGYHVKLEKISFGPILVYRPMSISLTFGQCNNGENTHAYVSPTCSEYEPSTTTI
eukprot:351247_1